MSDKNVHPHAPANPKPGVETVKKQEENLANETDGAGRKDPTIANPPHNTHDGKPAPGEKGTGG